MKMFHRVLTSTLLVALVISTPCGPALADISCSDTSSSSPAATSSIQGVAGQEAAFCIADQENTPASIDPDFPGQPIKDGKAEADATQAPKE